MNRRLNKLSVFLLLLSGGTIIFVALFASPLTSPSESMSEGAQDLGHGYQRNGDHILFHGKHIDREGRHDIDDFAQAVGHSLTLCRDVDASSFVALSEEYSKDTKHVYYKWISPGRFWIVVLPDADPATFAVLDFNLAKDDRHVWKGDTVISGADPATAEVVNPHWTWKDRIRVYYQSQIMEGADPATFRHLGQAFYADATHVYWSTTLLSETDVETFETYGDVPYARDRSHVWAAAKVLQHVQAKSFQLLHNHVYKDSTHVFVGTQGHEVVGADPATFEKVDKVTGHNSVFEPEKHGVTFPGHDAVLFRDRMRFYLFEPDYGEMYALESEGVGIVISKPVRTDRRLSVSATLTTSDALSAPALSGAPGNLPRVVPADERSKFKQYLPLFIAAREMMSE